MKVSRVLVWGVVLCIILFGFYFTKINNIFAIKPEIEKPELEIDFIEQNPGVQIIEEEHLEYLANELGSYKLHSSSGEDAVLVFEVTDVNINFAFIANGESYVTQDIPANIDLIIKGDQITIARLINSENLVYALQSEFEEGNIEIEIISDETTLAMKGYLSIYESIV